MGQAADRRHHTRFPTCIAVGLDTSAVEGSRLGVAHDVSAGGLLLNTHTRFEPGTEVEVTTLLPDSHQPVQLRATVVRTVEVPRDSSLTWRWLTAVEFEHEAPELVGVLARAPHGPPSARA